MEPYKPPPCLEYLSMTDCTSPGTSLTVGLCSCGKQREVNLHALCHLTFFKNAIAQRIVAIVT
jgi:hypothetical protein